MIRSAFVAISLAIVTIIVGPPLVLYVALTGNIDPLYNAGVAAVVWICRVAGMRTRVEGLENIPRGTVLFAANHTSNADGPAIVGAMPRRTRDRGRVQQPGDAAAAAQLEADDRRGAFRLGMPGAHAGRRQANPAKRWTGIDYSGLG